MWVLENERRDPACLVNEKDTDNETSPFQCDFEIEDKKPTI